MAKQDLYRTVELTVRNRRMIEKSDRVLVAVSGGPDSVAMLSVLAELAPLFDLTLHVFHLDHKLRRGSAADARFVGDLASSMELAATLIGFDVSAYCRERHVGVETGAREVRYQLMDEVAREVGATKIATGHTLDDQVETFLMRLARGAGTTGLRAIPPVRGRYIRPLIDASRNQVLEYCASRGLDFRVDETNHVPDQPRNVLRLDVVPMLRRINPRFDATVARTVEILSDEDEYMLSEAIIVFDGLARKVGDAIRIQREDFRMLDAAVARRVLRLAIETLEPEAPGVDAAQVEEVLRQLGRGDDCDVHLSGGLELYDEYGELVITRRTERATDVRTELSVPGETDVPELDIALRAAFVDRAGLRLTPSDGRRAAIDAGRVDGPLVLTTPKPGDRFQPFGMIGTKKLSDFFVDGKVPKRQRAKVPVVRCDEDIVWVVGMRIDERYRVCAETKKVLLLEAVQR